MANFMSLPAELRIMVYKYLLTEEVQPTACKYPPHIPICRMEAYVVYLSSNNIIFDNSRAACLWLEHISPYLSTQREQPLHLTFDLRHDCDRPVGKDDTRKADQKRLFRLLAPRTKLDLTLLSGGYLVGGLFACGALDLTHGFASASSTPAPAVDSGCRAHRRYRPYEETYLWRLAERRAVATRSLLDYFTSPCPADCEHLAGGKTWNSESTIHLDVNGLKGDPANCFFCFSREHERRMGAPTG